MCKKRMLSVLLCLSLFLSIISISKTYSKYTNKSNNFHMIYEVKEGEKLSDVADRFNVSKEKLIELNNCSEYVGAGTRLKIESN